MTPAALLLLATISESGVEEKLAQKDAFEVSGRFQARETVSRARGPWTGESEIARAHLGVGWKRDDLEVVVEADLAKRAELEDAFARLDLGPAKIRAGRFKMPSSAIESESSWTLPTARRGELHDVLKDGLQVSGRRSGAAVSAKSKRGLDPEASAGAWQALGADGDPRRGGGPDLFGQCAGARAGISPGPISAGAFGAWRSMEPYFGAAPERHWAAGADLALDHRSGARVWVEGVAGSSPFALEEKRALFSLARAILAWRIGGAETNASFLEPYVMAGTFDPDANVTADLATEVSMGINAGRWERWRVQLELSESQLERNVPPTLVERAEIAERRMAVLQMGVSF